MDSLKLCTYSIIRTHWCLYKQTCHIDCPLHVVKQHVLLRPQFVVDHIQGNIWILAKHSPGKLKMGAQQARAVVI